jgi:hypothetical protein
MGIPPVEMCRASLPGSTSVKGAVVRLAYLYYEVMHELCRGARDRLGTAETLDVSGYRVGLGVIKAVSNLSQDTTCLRHMRQFPQAQGDQLGNHAIP